MDGSYGNVFGGNRSMSPGSPASSNEQYKVNVSRQKTRKWAEFKPQNYDGDDWGAEPGDDDEEAPPPPPQKPMGPRQPSAPLPSSRQFAAGGPPLHVQTQRVASTPAGPASAGGLLERTGLEHIASPQPAVPQSAAPASSGYPNAPTSAHPGAVPSRTRSPAAPQGTGPVATRFPPRKSSIGAHDIPSLADSAPHSRTSSRPGSSQATKPWTEGRSASPATSARSPLASPTKPLPFIRPADIYRRMEEEKERRSMESGGRPSLDGLVGRPDPSSLPNTAGQPQEAAQKRVEEGTDAGRNIRPTLPPVAERKSEYGLEGLIASYGSDDAAVDPAPAIKAQPRAASPPAVVDHPRGPRVLPSQSSRPASDAELRHLSISPKLPELGRLSGFGPDLFGSPSRFSVGDLAMPTILDNSPPAPPASQSPPLGNSTESADVARNSPMAPFPPVVASTSAPDAQLGAAGRVPTQLSSENVQAGSVTQPVQSATSTRSASPPNEPDQPVRHPSPQNRGDAAPPTPGVSRQQVPVTDASRQPADDKQGKRPTLPGTWVTETLATPDDLATPRAPDLSRAVARKAVDSADVSPVTDDISEDALAKLGKQRHPAGDGVSDTVSETSATRQQISAASHPGSPLALPPLRTASPALSSSIRMASSGTASQAGDEDVTSLQPQGKDSGIDAPVSAPPDIPPIAPLNPSRSPRRADTVESFVPPPSFDASSTLDTTSSSPLKESDVLREEIIKSLSPLGPSNESLQFSGGSTAAYHAAAGTVRESTYLGDVYGDYWAAPDDPPVPNPVESGQKTDAPKPTESSTAPEVAASTEKEHAPEGLLEEQDRRSGLRKRFSWEMSEAAASQRSVAETPVEQKSLVPGSEAGNVIVTEPTLPPPEATAPAVSVPSKGTPTGLSQAPASGITYQVSGASTLQPRSAMDSLAEPPSPVSVLSERIPHPIDTRRLSLADEKAQIRTSSNPLSPSPPLDQHPAVMGDGAPMHQIISGPTSPTGKETLNIMPFRQIMELPSPSERIKSYNDTRSQFAAIDTGLNDWILTMKARHPEHANVTSSFRDGLAGPSAPPGTQQGLPGPAHSGVHAPFFHQHPNASTTGVGQEGRSPANMPMPPPLQHSPNTFGHSSNQVGTKGKELFMAAGKAGKGLLSKGKSKLRGTGDKVFFNS